MRVTVAAHRLATPNPTGVDRYLRELVGALARRDDVEVGIAATPEPDAVEWAPSNVAVHELPGPRKLTHLRWCLTGRPRIDRWAGQPDLVHVAVPGFPFPSRAPVVYMVHDVMVARRPEWFGRIERWSFECAMADAADRAAALVVNSEATATSLTEFLNVDRTRISVVTLGLSPRFLEPLPPDAVTRARTAAGVDGDYVVYVGQVNERKNVAVLVRALADVDPAVQLVIAGPEGRGADHVRAEVDRLRLQDRVRFTGFFPEDDLPGLLAGARALLHPSQYEGFGFTPLEAMAVGTPAVVADATSLPEETRSATLPAAIDDPSQWARAIAELGDAGRRADLVAAGRQHASQLTWERTAEATVAVWRRVLD